MQQHARLTYISYEDYLAYEQHSGDKHEYVAGQIYAMVGTTDRHNLIALNIASYVRTQLRGSPCRVFMSDVKVRIEMADASYYPDVFVTCDGRDQDPYVKHYPCLVVEVLSPRPKAPTGGKSCSTTASSTVCRNMCWWIPTGSGSRFIGAKRMAVGQWTP